MRLNEIRTAVSRAREAAAGEDKSSAGDKYETSRAMSHLDLERYGQQEKNLLEEWKILDLMDPSKTFDQAVPGTLLQTNEGLLYIAAAIGVTECDGIRVTVVSGKSPLALAFKHKKAGDMVLFNQKKYLIESCC